MSNASSWLVAPTLQTKKPASGIKISVHSSSPELPEQQSGITGRIVVVHDHLVDVSAGCPEQEYGGASHCGQTQFVASAPGEEADKGEAETGEAELSLERASR